LKERGLNVLVKNERNLIKYVLGQESRLRLSRIKINCKISHLTCTSGCDLKFVPGMGK